MENVIQNMIQNMTDKELEARLAEIDSALAGGEFISDWGADALLEESSEISKEIERRLKK